MSQTGETYVNVLLPVPLDSEFTYRLPDRYVENARAGCRVIVQLGKRKLYSGLIKSIHRNKPDYEVKDIDLVLDESPIMDAAIFTFWKWMADYYCCTEGEIMKAAIPAGLKLESQTQIYANPEYLEDEFLTPGEQSVFQFVISQKKTSIREINSISKRANAYPLVQSLLEKNAIRTEEEISKSYKVKTRSYLRINKRLDDEGEMENTFKKLKRAEKQLELLMFLLNELNFYAPQKRDAVSKKEVLKKKPGTEHLLKALMKKQIIEQFEVEIERLPEVEKSTEKKELNSKQEKALNEIYASFRTKEVTLLHGVTSSGKTEIYIRLIEQELKRGKQVLYLLPEIALTSQIIERLTAVFGASAGVYHSKFNDNERVEIWNRVNQFSADKQNKHQLILGARSALLLPFKNLGLIIVDEEHENSYKQFDPAPRYNARDMSVVLAKLHNAKVLMGTATPSFESYFNAQSGKYAYVQLQQRFGDIALPDIEVADLKDAYKRKQMKAHFTPQLFGAIEQCLVSNEQIILFQNRRGFSPFIQCRNCGHIPKCMHCDVSLTYHKYHNNLQCHYCGYSLSTPGKCSECGSTDVQTKGFGTEKIEDDIKTLFPDVRVARLDYDSTRSKSGFETTIRAFSQGKTQILIGTQMITKGLDFDNVALVGILNADNLLNFPDFRAYERAYQLMAQVSGRAGRRKKTGRVIIQTAQPNHEVIKLVMQNNYHEFFRQYISERKLFSYPPTFRLIYITVKHKKSDRAMQAAVQLAKLLRSRFRDNILGPEYHLISRVKQYYQLMIRIKLSKTSSPVSAKEFITASVDKVKKSKNNASVVIQINVDPY